MVTVPPPHHLTDDLSKREKYILEPVGTGPKLHADTVKNQMTTILKKLHVCHRVGALMFLRCPAARQVLARLLALPLRDG